MILDQYLTESGFGEYGSDYNVEPTNEGFDFDFGGMERIEDLCEAESHALHMAMMVTEVQTCNLLEEGANLQAEQLQENVLSSFWEKIKTIIKKMWARVKEVVNSVLLQFTKLANDKAFLTQAKKILNGENFDASGLELEGFTFTLDKVDPLKAYKDMIAAAKSKFNISCSVGTDKEDAANKADAAKKLLDTANSSDSIDEYVKAGYDCTVSDLDDHLFKVLRSNSDTSSEMSFDKSSCIKAIDGYKAAVNRVNSLKSQMDSAYKSALKEVEELKKENDKTVSNNELEGPKQQVMRAVYRDHADMLKTLLNYANRGCSAKLKALKDERAQAKSMIMKAISKSKKNNKESKNKTWGESSNILDSLMNQFN